MIPTVRIQSDDFDVAEEIEAITKGNADVGAVVTFSGLCRDEQGTLEALEIEHYPVMAEAEISRIAEDTAQRWPLSGLTAIHRFGRIEPGQNIVLVIAASKHRQAAFEAASFLMDYLKSRAPFWKKEHRVDGSSGDWVEAKDSDDVAAARWGKSDTEGYVDRRIELMRSQRFAELRDLVAARHGAASNEFHANECQILWETGRKREALDSVVGRMRSGSYSVSHLLLACQFALAERDLAATDYLMNNFSSRLAEESSKVLIAYVFKNLRGLVATDEENLTAKLMLPKHSEPTMTETRKRPKQVDGNLPEA